MDDASVWREGDGEKQIAGERGREGGRVVAGADVDGCAAGIVRGLDGIGEADLRARANGVLVVDLPSVDVMLTRSPAKPSWSAMCSRGISELPVTF